MAVDTSIIQERQNTVENALREAKHFQELINNNN